jgi:predicted transposase YbfD/YdcC
MVPIEPKDGTRAGVDWWLNVKGLTPTPPSEPLKPSTGAAVRDHRNAVRDRSESLSAIDRNHCPHSPESAFAARQRLVLGQVKVAEKSNEIVAIPALLDMLAIEGAIVSIDAIGCQRDIAEKIVVKKADYVLALKGNQGTLREDVELFATEQKAKGFKDTKVSHHQTVDGDHGRIETRTYTAFHDLEWLKERHDWPGLNGVVMVESVREIGDKIERETRFYITSLTWLACQLGPVVRSHWAIENSLHWVMDMIFRDDECRIRTEHAPANFTTIKHMAHNLIRKAPGKPSFRAKRKIAAWDDDFLASLIAA